ncbi:MAG: hypothetical protein OEZ22_09965 [Spirochaetia bacterium]|nr:hypothetical protein [Spirochaetia bacterium]
MVILKSKLLRIFIFFALFSFSVYGTENDENNLLPEQRKYLLTADINYGNALYALSGFLQYYYFNSFNLGAFLAITDYTLLEPKVKGLDTSYHISIQPMFSFGYTYFYKWFSADASYLFGFEYTMIKEKFSVPEYNINRTYSTYEILYDSGALFSLRAFIYNKAAVNFKFLFAMPDFRKSIIGLGVVFPFGKKTVYE